MLDLLIINGTCPDFEAGEMIPKNIGLKNGKIAWLGTVGEPVPEAGEVIDAAGKVVTPGFIDIHMHEENFAGEGKEYSISQMMLDMGVTTAVGGNCGVQYQPLSEFKAILEEKGGAPVNYVMLAGYNSYRTDLGIGRYEHASQEQMESLKASMEKELAEGAWGISFGIEYDPGITYEEMLFACGASDNPRHLVAAHYREDCIGMIDPIEEMVKLSSEIPQKFQISHLSSCSAMGMMEASLNCINTAMETNPKLNYDTYPYNAFSTHMGSAVFEDGCLEGWGKDYDSILLTDDPYKNVYCTEEIFNKARAEYPNMLAVAFVMNEEEIAQSIANPNGMVASDAIINHGNGHPRAAGTFPRVLGKYVREDKVLPMIDALRKISYLPAQRIGLTAKGRLEAGCDADITIFNPDTIIDKADWTHLEAPEGIDYVLIGGQIAVKDGKRVND
ncbi:MAG: amidohydrolase family protein, partial [Firmicutes bacterium]|nr:amidohydrolase family protein [Bacillota bacterium]